MNETCVVLIGTSLTSRAQHDVLWLFPTNPHVLLSFLHVCALVDRRWELQGGLTDPTPGMQLLARKALHPKQAVHDIAFEPSFEML